MGLHQHCGSWLAMPRLTWLGPLLGCVLAAATPDPAAWSQGGIIAGPAQAPKGQPNAVFVAFDADANGALSAQELAALAQAMRAVLASPQPVGSVLAARFDTNRNGALEVIEVDQARQRLLSSQAAPAPAASHRGKTPAATGLEQTQTAFVVFEPITTAKARGIDTNRDGSIDAKELDAWQARTIIGLLEAEMDRDKNGLIDPKEFEAWEARTIIGSSRPLPAPAAK